MKNVRIVVVKLLALLVVILASNSLFAPASSAAPTVAGVLDPTFSGVGAVTTGFPFPTNAVPAASAQQADGKLVVVGNAFINLDYQFAVVRYNPDGTLDATFDGDGRVTTDFRYISNAEVDETALAVAVQPDGKIIAAGRAYTNADVDDNFALARYNPDGSLDASFGTGGKVQTEFTFDAAINAIAILPDGKILSAGGNGGGYDTRFALVRYNPDGSVDTSFGFEGKAITQAGNGGPAQANALVLLPDGKIVAVGYVRTVCPGGTFCTDSDFTLVRYNPDGSVDTTFGGAGTGQISTDFDGGTEQAWAASAQADGKIIVVGNDANFEAPYGNAALARYNADGTLDTSFGSAGKVVTDLYGASNSAAGVTVEPDGKITVGGTSSPVPGEAAKHTLLRYNNDGTLDTSFGDSGKVSGPTGGVSALVKQADGKLVLVGRIRIDNTDVFELSRFNSEGSLDVAFGSGGAVTTQYLWSLSNAEAVVIQPDGKIVVAGKASGITQGGFSASRYHPDGSLDASFGNSGRVLISFRDPNSNIGGGGEAHDLALQPDGKIVLAGLAYVDQQGNFALARLNADGNLDESFGTGGKVTSPVNGNAAAHAVAIQPDGKILAAGESFSDYAVARYNANGTLDSSFGTSGVTTFQEFAHGAQDMVIDGNGKIIVVGTALNNTPSSAFLVARLNPDGSLDSSFAGDGRATAGLTEGFGEANAVAIQSDGKIVAAGMVGESNGTSFGMVRLNSDGSLDPAFGGDGAVVTDFSPGPNLFDAAYALAVQPDNKILVGGGFGSFLLARYKADGTLDTAFGSNGRAPAPFAEGTPIYGLALQPDNKIVAVGGARQGYDLDVAVARYENDVVPPGCLFTDVCPSDFFFTPVQYLVQHGAISGYADNSYRPFNNTTRSQLTKIVVLAEGWTVDTQGGPHFRDVPQSNTFYGYVETAVNHNIISGYANAQFCAPDAAPCFKPFNNVTRGQLSKIVVLAEGWTLVNPTTPTFVDVATTNPFYKEIETAVEHEIISGYDLPGGQREFRWINNATRGQIAKIVYLAVTGAAGK